MEAIIQINGTLVIIPQSPTEQYALDKWTAEAKIIVDDSKRKEAIYFRGSKILVLKEYVL